MRNLKFTFAAAAIAVFANLGIANAETSNDVVFDNSGGKVMDGFGGCVRTMWMSASDPCIKAEVKGDIISKIMKMEERKIYFDFDKHGLKTSEKDKLNVLASVLAKHNIKNVKIVGYTDPIGTEKYNSVLSNKRADAVKHYLDSKVKLDSSVVDLRGLGEANLVKDCKEVKAHKEKIKCLAPNRRVEIEVDYFDNMM